MQCDFEKNTLDFIDKANMNLKRDFGELETKKTETKEKTSLSKLALEEGENKKVHKVKAIGPAEKSMSSMEM